MKKIYFIIFLFIIMIGKSYSQEGYNYTIIKGGLSYEKAFNIAVAIDFQTTYYNSIEVSLNYYKSNENKIDFEKVYENYLLGLNYKINLAKNMNSNLLLKIGAYGGSDSHNFIIAPNLGLEYQIALTRGLQLLITNDNNYFFEANQNNWRTAFSAGLRINI